MRAGIGNTDLIPGSDTYRLPCGHRVDRSFVCCRPATQPFTETSRSSTPAPPPATSRNGEKLRTAGLARRAFCSPTPFAAATAVNPPAALSLSGERGCTGDSIVARTPGGVVDGAMERSADDGITFLRPPQRRRRGLLCPGMMVESITIAGREPFVSAYCGPLHLLIAHEQLSRRRGLTSIEGLPDSTRENLTQTLTFVPAGHQFREWHLPDTAARIIYIHIHPSAMALIAGRGIDAQPLVPRLQFYNSVLWQTVLKVKTLVEAEGARSAHYGNALGVVLAHELVHQEQDARHRQGSDRGGLAAWQRRLVAQHVEEHLAERLPISRLAKLARLSCYHFCRSFRHSFGLSPHRYHLHRRAERAKRLLANPTLSITDIALDLGFPEASTFSTTFRKLVGRTPTDYRRSLLPSKG
jgi:AraC family transcriptional regulator